MCYWVIQGIGIPVSSIIGRIDAEKCIKVLTKILPDKEIETDSEKFHIEDYLYGQPFYDMSELLWECDDSGLLSYSSDGDGESYLYYAPKYPWEITNKDPRSIKEVHDIISNSVKKICNMTEEEIEERIDNYLYSVGCG